MKLNFNDLHDIVSRLLERADSDQDKDDCRFVLRIINAMTAKERLECDIVLVQTACERIAANAKVSIEHVKELANHMKEMTTLLNRMANEP